MDLETRKDSYRSKFVLGTQYYRQPTPLPAEWQDDLKKGKAWGDFETVDPPHTTADFAEMHLWRQWAATRVAWRVKQVTDAVKAVDPTREVVAHVGMSSVVQDVMGDTSDDYLTRKSVDFYGSSLEIRYTPAPLDMSWPFLITDWMRSVSGDGYFWINELYPSRGRWEPEISPETIGMWNWASVACGAKGIILWQFRKERLGYETNDAGLMETDGRDNPTSLHVDKVFHTIRKHEKQFRAARVPKAKVAMVYDFESDLVSRIEETNHDGDMSLQRGWKYNYKEALQGAYHLFWMAGVQVDVISSHELHRIADYEMVYLPIMFIVDRKKAEILRQYVADGGKLVAEGGTAQRDGNTWLHPTRPGAGMDELFGLIETNRLVDETDENTVILPNGELAVSQGMSATFQLRTARMVAKYQTGTPAVTENRFGKGLAIMTAFSAGFAYLRQANPAWARWFRELTVELAGVRPEPSFIDTGIYTRRLDGEDGPIWFLFNPTTEKHTWTVPMPGTELTSQLACCCGEKLEIMPGQTAIILAKASQPVPLVAEKKGRPLSSLNVR